MKKLIFVALAIFFFACSGNKETKFSLIDHIPASTEVFLFSEDLSSSLSELQKNDFLSKSNFSFKQKLNKQLAFFKHLELKQPAGISFSNLDSETFTYILITKKDSSLLQLDSLKNKSVETIKENGISFRKIGIDDQKFFFREKGSSAFISNSKQSILDIDDQEKLLEDENFKKAFNASDASKLSVILRHGTTQGLNEIFKKLHFTGFKNFASWSSLDLDITKSFIKINGLSISENTDQIASPFSGTQARNIESAKVCPEDFLSMSAIGFSSFRQIQDNISKARKDSTRVEYPKILDHTREISLIQLKEGTTLVLNAIEIEAAREKLAGMGSVSENFRGYDIIELEQKIDFQPALNSLMHTGEFTFYTVIEHFVIFSQDAETLKKHISDFLNSDIIAEKSYYSEVMASLSSESSMIFITRLPEFIDSQDKHNKTSLKFEKNSLAALQFINEDGYSHIHGVFSNSKEAAMASNGAEQAASFKLDHPLITDPLFFRNHRTDQMDIAVQDENNQLYLLSNKGNIFWKEKLDSKITSPVYQVDLFKNGNLQLAFSTGYNMEVLDRNGNKVKGYPIKFNSPLTQPLSVFDYDNNRNYRFVLTQDKKVYMVGPKGKAIKGFDFNAASSEIVKAPKHIRLGNKDYILIAEKSGKLNILSRQGNIRVPLSQTFDFSENEWYGHDNKFISTAPTTDLIEISQQGKVSKKDLELAENNRIVANDRHLVYLNENLLNIDGKSINLDFGLYTDPQLFQFRKRTLIALTDTQTQKVYVFNDKAELLDGFPVYGTSKVDIANADLDSRLEMLVKGEENEILLYKL
ncbi:hypothetical protein GCM10023115_38410 [Pontixanthobacter gangjinensis]|uniref:Uncharacterized protein n=1 Tax=Christiangramia aestuarii TaxID=1028746 RepID=A0A7K1LR90_9FLAO|nr:hypothetical protein [Christiangramia aestuarii]MUP42990.1 hypothetical protein [Christiangramia aestuarii]